MARIVGGSMIGELSGKMGGIVFSRNKSGPYMRQYVVPTDPNTLAQQNARANFGSAAAGWHALTNAEKMAWQSFAGSGFNPLGGSGGETFSGINAFMSLQATVNNANEKLLDPTASGDFVLSSDGGTITVGGSLTYQNTVLPPVEPNPDGLWGIDTGYGANMEITSVGYVSSTGVLTLTIGLSPAIGPLLPLGPVGDPVTLATNMVDGIGQSVGYTAYISNAVQQAQDFISNPNLINAGYVAPGTTLTGDGMDATLLTMVMKPSFLISAFYQALPAPGEIRRITLYQVSRTGTHKLIGARTCTIT